MTNPDLILRKQLLIEQSRNVSFNLLNLNCWPLWNKVANRILSLPMFPELHEEEIKYVVEKINEYFK